MDYIIVINEEERRALQQACREYTPKQDMKENAFCQQALLRELDQRLLVVKPIDLQAEVPSDSDLR